MQQHQPQRPPPPRRPPPDDPPESVRLLTSLLRSDPIPTELGIAILRAPSSSSSSSSDDDDDDDDNDASDGDGHEDDGDGDGDKDDGDKDVDNSYPRDSFVKVESRLGVHATDLPRLAREFRGHYRSLRRPFLDIIVAGDHDGVSGNADDDDDEERERRQKERWCRAMFDATSCLLVLCPDDSTAWADRRRSLLRTAMDMKATTTTGGNGMGTTGEGGMIGEQEGGGGDRVGVAHAGAEAEAEAEAAALRSELRFLDMLFTQHSKKTSAWAHRKWVCSRLVGTFDDLRVEEEHDEDDEEDGEPPLPPLLAWAEAEIRSMTIVAESYPKNYYAWTHRLHVVRTVVRGAGDSSCGAGDGQVVEVKRLLEREVSCTGPWLRRHVSDHSAAHYGSEVLRLLLRFEMGRGENSIDWGLKVVSAELLKARELLEAFPSHETLWLYRRYCAAIYAEVLSSAGEVGAPDRIMDAAIERFAQIEVQDVSGDAYLADHCLRVETPARAKSYPLAYVTWLRYHVMIRLKLHAHDRRHHRDLARVVDEAGMRGAKELRRSSDDHDDYSVPHNMWRSSEGPMPC